MQIIRLKNRKDFVRTAKTGKKVVTSGLVLQTVVIPDDVQNQERPATSFIRVGFTATKKLGGAVIRNRIKRKLRALVDAIFMDHAISGIDYVIIGRKSALSRPYAKLEKDLKYALHQSQCYTRER